MSVEFFPDIFVAPPPLTLAQAEAGNDTTQGTLDGAVFQQAIADAAHFDPVAILVRGQTAIPLGFTPLPGRPLALVVNGIAHRNGEIAVSGNVLTWNGPFALAPSDDVAVSTS